jgi:hypothetical protein
MSRLAALPVLCALAALGLGLPSRVLVQAKNMKFSKTLSFDDNLGDALKDLVSGMKEAESSNKAGGACSFKCPGGARATKRAGFLPVADGCMTSTFNVEMDGYEQAESEAAWEAHGLTSCCDAHDECYGTCGKPKKTCDRKLVDCMRAKCPPAADGHEQCMKSARHMEEWSKVGHCRLTLSIPVLTAPMVSALATIISITNCFQNSLSIPTCGGTARWRGAAST